MLTDFNSSAVAHDTIGAVDAPISVDEIRAHIAILASDDFGGRAPGTIGEQKTIAYIAQNWAQAGLVSGTNNVDAQWFQPVGLIQRKPFAQTVQMRIRERVKTIDESGFLLVGRDEMTSVSGDVVYVGFGVNAQGMVVADVAGKIAIMLRNDPPFDENDADLSRNTRLAALRNAGARSILLVAPDNMSWSSLRAAVTNRSTTLAADGDPVEIGGYLSIPVLGELLKTAKVETGEAALMANDAGFRGLPLPVTLNLAASTQIYAYDSHNIIGKIPGKKPGSGAVLLLGHWDHLGECGAEGDEDRICNGAVDNASGIAALIAIANRLGDGPPLDRDVYFLATTAEEKGLLGAHYFASHPTLPLDQIIVALNLDTIAIAPKGSVVAIVGRGETGFDDEIDAVARALGRPVETSTDANAFIQRQDGWALLAKDVPAFMAGGSFSDIEMLQEFLSGPYHGADDELHAASELGGAAEDADLHVALVRRFARADFAIPSETDANGRGEGAVDAQTE